MEARTQPIFRVPRLHTAIHLLIELLVALFKPRRLDADLSTGLVFVVGGEEDRSCVDVAEDVPPLGMRLEDWIGRAGNKAALRERKERERQGVRVV